MAAHRDVQVVISGSCPMIAADVELLKIVFLNLFLNSAHAMRQKGTIAVSLTAGDGYVSDLRSPTPDPAFLPRSAPSSSRHS